VYSCSDEKKNWKELRTTQIRRQGRKAIDPVLVLSRLTRSVTSPRSVLPAATLSEEMNFYFSMNCSHITALKYAGLLGLNAKLFVIFSHIAVDGDYIPMLYSPKWLQ
jgi:hypothetical protein